VGERSKKREGGNGVFEDSTRKKIQSSGRSERKLRGRRGEGKREIGNKKSWSDREGGERLRKVKRTAGKDQGGGDQHRSGGLLFSGMGKKKRRKKMKSKPEREGKNAARKKARWSLLEGSLGRGAGERAGLQA